MMKITIRKMIKSKRKIKSRIMCARHVGPTLNLPLALNHLPDLPLDLIPSLGDRRYPTRQSRIDGALGLST